METMVEPEEWSRSFKGRAVLVTGATGFIGSWIAHQLTALGALVVTIVRDHVPRSNFELLKLRDTAVVVRGSVTDLELMRRVISDYEITLCYHLAAQSLVTTSKRAPIATFETNIRGTWVILEALRQLQADATIVVASSDKVYGEALEGKSAETDSLSAVYPYEVSKLCADTIARCYRDTYGMKIVVVRPVNVYGGGDFNLDRLIPGTIVSVLRGIAPVIRSDGSYTREYIYIADVVDAYLRIGTLGDEEIGGIAALNVGSDEVAAAADVASIICKLMKTTLEPKVLAQKSAETELRRQCLSSELIRSRLAWASQTDLRTGLLQTIEWYESHAHHFV